MAIDEASLNGLSSGQEANSFAKIVDYTVRRPTVSLAVIVLLVVSLAALFAPQVAPQDPTDINPRQRLLPIGSPGYPLGSDDFGRDVFSRVIWGARISLMSGVVPAVLAMVIGGSIGLVAGYVGGRLDDAVIALADLILSFPFMLLAIVLVAVLGPSLRNAMIAVVVGTIPRNIRIVRGQTLSLKEQPFIDAARVVGYSDLRIIFSEIMPNVLVTAITLVTMDVTLMIGATSGLSFVGLGVQPPQADWGAMVWEAKKYITKAPHLTLVPSLMIAIVCIGFAIVGDELQRLLSSRERG